MRLLKDNGYIYPSNGFKLHAYKKEDLTYEHNEFRHLQ